MKTITMTQFMRFQPCYSKAKIADIRGDKRNWSALDILELSEIPAQDRMWAVLREAFIDAPILHEFACRCAETALALVENPDPRSVAAIAAKRAWLRGDVSNDNLEAAGAAAWATAGAAAGAAAWAAAGAAAGAAARAAARKAAWAAAGAAAKKAAREAALEAQIKMLISMLEDATNEKP